MATDGVSSNNNIGTLGELQKNHPDDYKKFMDGKAQESINDVKDKFDKARKRAREAENA